MNADDELEWSSALMQADETGDLRQLFELMLTKLVRAGVEVPEWACEELAELLTVRRLSGRRRRSREEEQARHARATYFSIWSRKPGETRARRIERVIAALKLSEEQANAFHNFMEGGGRPIEHVRQEKKDAGAVGKYERSLRELLRKHQPPYPTAKR